MEEIPSCPLSIPPQYKLIFLHSITMLSLILVWALRNNSSLECRSDLTSKSLIRSASASLQLCWVPQLGLIRFPGHIQITWHEVFPQKQPVPTQDSGASTGAVQSPALRLLGRQFSCAKEHFTEFFYTMLLLLQLQTAVTFLYWERPEHWFPWKTQQYYRTTLSQPFHFSMRQDLPLAAKRCCSSNT